MKHLYRINGAPSFIYNTPVSIALILLLFSFFTVPGYAQVNAYAKVTAYSAANKRLTITNRNVDNHTFAVGEQIIIMQMQDNVIGGNTDNDANFGKLDAIANAGIYEIGTISAVTSTRITLTAALTQTYNYSTGNVQVISFTQLGTTNYTTTEDITAVPWDPYAGTGGVVAFWVNGVLTLNHSVITDGQGFIGGDASTNYENSCEPTVYTTNSTRYGAKGEGIYLNTEEYYSRGRARLLTGGGGGSDDNAGGAGGGNYSAGGDGGAGWTCSANPAGGLGGISLNTYMMTGARLFMGGGGGGGQGDNSTQTAGGNGGGIIIIKANSITTNCTTSLRISANGNTGSNTSGTGNDGAGGAGAAGTILLQVGSFSVPATCKLNIQANGGTGGSVINTGAHGGGGGGGQGAILFTNALPNANIIAVTKPGQGGLNNTGGTSAGSGSGSNNSGVIGGGVVLPVKLISFAAVNKNKKAVLSWTTTNESNITYNIQHATEGGNFTTIGTVKGTGNMNATTNYTFTDPNIVLGKNLYRLEMNDNVTAHTDYAVVATVNITEVQNTPVAWPNPAHDQFSVRVSTANPNKNYVITISDIAGHVIYSNSYKPANSIITVTPGQALKPGLYMYKITGDGAEQTGKLIIQ